VPDPLSFFPKLAPVRQRAEASGGARPSRNTHDRAERARQNCRVAEERRRPAFFAKNDAARDRSIFPRTPRISRMPGRVRLA